MRKFLVTLAVAAALAACGRGAPSTQGPTSTTRAPSTTTTTAAPTSSTTGAPGGPVNLTVTDQVRTELIAAGASVLGVPASEYSGLYRGFTFYGYDPATNTYWAGAALVGAQYDAQVSTQDDGSYILFHRTGDQPWAGLKVGMVGPNGPMFGATPCPETPPGGILAVWGWPAGTCHPNM